jgi:hypothetical protein
MITNRTKIFIAALVTVFVIVPIIMVIIFPPGQTGGDSSGVNSDQSQSDSPTIITQEEVFEAQKREKSTLITNYDDQVRNLSAEVKINLQNALYETILLNNTGANPQNISDATIRAGSYIQDYVASVELYTTQFMVDIPSLQQSYHVRNKYSPHGEDVGGVSYRYLILCPTAAELIYAPFSCKDAISVEQNM